MKSHRKTSPSPRLAEPVIGPAPEGRTRWLATPLPQGERGQRICVGKFGAPHGIRGEVKVWPFTTDPLAIAEYGVLESADGARSFEIEALRPARDFLVARVKGISTRSAAEALRNIELFVPRERLPAIEEADEFYYADLVGLAVVDRGGTRLGTIIAVHNFGAGDLLELKLDDAPDTLLIPFTALTVPELDVPGGRIVVDLAAVEGGATRDEEP